MTDEYDAIARRFFNQFIELVLAHGTTRPPNYDRELAQYKKAAEQFKKAAQDLAAENERMEEALTIAEEQLMAERGRVNELLITVSSLKEKLEGLGVVRAKQPETGYSFVEHMDPDSRKVWESLMRAPQSDKS